MITRVVLITPKIHWIFFPCLLLRKRRKHVVYPRSFVSVIAHYNKKQSESTVILCYIAVYISRSCRLLYVEFFKMQYFCIWTCVELSKILEITVEEEIENSIENEQSCDIELDYILIVLLLLLSLLLL